METQISNLPITNKCAKVKINITPFIAKQKANVFLLTHLGNLVWANEPSLLVTNETIRWIIPVFYTFPKHASKHVADLAMDVNTGEILLRESKPSNLSEIEESINLCHQIF